VWAADTDAKAGVKHDGDDENEADAEPKRFLAASPCCFFNVGDIPEFHFFPGTS
jgi:hypothetical protein